MEIIAGTLGAAKSGAKMQRTAASAPNILLHQRTIDCSIEKVVRAVSSIPEQKMTVKNAARIAGVSERHFCTLFRRQLNVPFASWCRQHRVSVACSATETFARSNGPLRPFSE
jgi:transcriptional regulator GlxA family with amidase domain